MAQNATEDDQTDVSTKTRIAAERIADETGLDVTARDWPSAGEVIIVQFSGGDMDVNSYQKGRIITAVFDCGANVELRSACDGEERLEFTVVDVDHE